MIASLVISFIHALFYLAMTLAGLLWLCTSDTSDESAPVVQPIGRSL